MIAGLDIEAHSMYIELNPGVAMSALHPVIERFVSEQEEGPYPMAEKFLAIKNEAGEVYCVIVADGLMEAIAADKFLVSIGCTEEPSSQYNSLFRVPPTNA